MLAPDTSKLPAYFTGKANLLPFILTSKGEQLLCVSIIYLRGKKSPIHNALFPHPTKTPFTSPESNVAKKEGTNSVNKYSCTFLIDLLI